MQTKLECFQTVVEVTRKQLEWKTKELEDSQKGNVLTPKRFNQLYLSFKGEKVSIDKDFELSLDLSKQQDMQLITVLSNFKLPKFYKLYLNHIPEDRASEVCRFLRNSLPNGLKTLWFNCYSTTTLEGGNFLKSLIRAGPKVTYDFVINQFKLTTAEFVELLAAFKHCEKLEFLRCAILTDDKFSFGTKLDDAAFSKLSFNTWGKSNKSNWKEKPDRFKNIIEALGNVEDVQDNMKKLYMADSCMEEDYVRDLLNTLGLWQVKIWKM